MVNFIFKIMEADTEKLMEMQLDEVFAIIMEEIGVCLMVRFY